ARRVGAHSTSPTRWGTSVSECAQIRFLGRHMKHSVPTSGAMTHLESNIVALAGERAYEFYGLAGLPAVSSRTWFVRCLTQRGEFVAARMHAEEGQRIAEELGHPFALTSAGQGIGILELICGQAHRAVPSLERALTICESRQIVASGWQIASLLGAAYIQGGRLPEAIELLNQTGFTDWISRFFREFCLGEAYREMSLSADALAHATRALTLAPR